MTTTSIMQTAYAKNEYNISSVNSAELIKKLLQMELKETENYPAPLMTNFFSNSFEFASIPRHFHFRSKDKKK